MDVYEAIKTRRSIRRYLDNPVEWEKIGQILEAGKAAPSAGNLQDWKFIVITDKAQRQKIAHACMDQDWMVQAPIHIVVVGMPDKTKRFYGERGKFYTTQDCAAAIQNMLLMAHSLGLGSCWVGSFEDEALRKSVSIPSEIKPQAVMTLGYPDEVVPEPPEFTLENVMFFRNYGLQPNRIKNIPVQQTEYGQIIQDKLKKGRAVFKRMSDKLQRK